jgi:hypothetical protein
MRTIAPILALVAVLIASAGTVNAAALVWQRGQFTGTFTGKKYYIGADATAKPESVKVPITLVLSQNLFGVNMPNGDNINDLGPSIGPVDGFATSTGRSFGMGLHFKGLDTIRGTLQYKPSEDAAYYFEGKFTVKRVVF